MVRAGRILALALGGWTCLGGALSAQVPDRPRPEAAHFQSGSERWQNMSPAERQRFKANIERWKQLSPETQRGLRAREIARHERFRREAEAAMREAGIRLEKERQAQFEKRYLEERERLERELQREMREKRKRVMAPVVEQLKKELVEGASAQTPGPRAIVTPTPSMERPKE